MKMAVNVRSIVFPTTGKIVPEVNGTLSAWLFYSSDFPTGTFTEICAKMLFYSFLFNLQV